MNLWKDRTMLDPQSERSYRLVCVFLVVITLAAYWKVVGFNAVYFDDPYYVTDNPRVRAGITPETVGWAFTTRYQQNWYPLAWISLMADNDISKALSFVLMTGSNESDPRVNHTTNLLLHILNTILLFTILDRMTKLRWRSAFVAALFAVHPLHVESVAWISERKDVLSTFFWMLTVWAYVGYTEKPEVRKYALVALAFVLGLLSKPMLVSLPLVLLLLDYWPLGRVKAGAGWKRLILEKVPLFVLSAGSCAVTLWAQGPAGSAVVSAYPAGVRAANASVSYIKYLIKMLWPKNLSVFYVHPGTSLPAWQVALSALALVTVSLLALRAARRYPYAFVGWFWYVMTLLPAIGFVQVGMHGMADRFAYVPLIGIFIAITWSISEALDRKPKIAPVSGHLSPFRALLAGSVILTFTVCSFIQVGYWRNGVTLFQRAVEIDPQCPAAQAYLGWALKRTGKPNEAAQHYKKALQLQHSTVKKEHQ